MYHGVPCLNNYAIDHGDSQYNIVLDSELCAMSSLDLYRIKVFQNVSRQDFSAVSGLSALI